MAAERTALALLAGVLVATFGRDASAYCPSTTCDLKAHEDCQVEDGCIVTGARLHWDSRCLSFGVQKDGSPRRNISYQVADEIIHTAFQQWLGANCGGGRGPSFRIWDLGQKYGGIICDQPEFNALKPNANVWMFRDNDWPYEGDTSTLALTSTIFEKTSGALLDADVEINSFGIVLTTTGVAGSVEKDLQSIVTHEAGHFLGLGHSQDTQATMYQMYSAGDLNYRSLAVDDQKGICAIYPPDRDTLPCVAPTPAHGFSLYCGGGGEEGTALAKGCAVAARTGRSPAASALLVLPAVLLLRKRRRSRPSADQER